MAKEKAESFQLREENQRLQHSVQELSFLNEISTSINSAQSLNQVLSKRPCKTWMCVPATNRRWTT
jgi:hypothetical protein